MDAPGGATVPAEDGSRNYNGNTSRSKGRGSGQRNSGGHQRWIPAESRSSSSAARLSKEQEIPRKLVSADESSTSTVNNGASSVFETRLKGSNSNFRASGEVHSIDRRPNNDDHEGASKNTSSRGAIHSKGGGRDDSGGAGKKEISFVPYLPQDDAVVAGLGEKEGGVDASETQEVEDLLNEQLSALLCLPPRQFWRKVATDESLSVFLDSYLHFRRRWFDNPLGGPNVSVVAGDADLSRRAFMVLLRMSSNHDPGTPTGESLSANEHAGILLERRFLDIPKLMDIAAIYAHDNPELTQRLVSNVFKVLPGYTGELAAYITPLLEKIFTLHQRCLRAIEAITNPSAKGTKAVGFSSLHGEFLEVVDFLNDVMITLKAFVKAYPPAAKVIVSSGNPTSGQGLFLPALATVHDTLLPILQRGFAALQSSAEDQQPKSTETLSGQKGSDVVSQDRLNKLSARVVGLVWKLLELHYLEETPAENSKTKAVSNKAYEDAVWRGDSLVQAIVSLGPSDNDNDGFGGEIGSSVSRLVCTGAMLQSIERSHGLSFHILQARQRGTVVLDDAQQDYLSALLADSKPSKGGQENSLIVSTESFPLLLTLPAKKVEEETVIQQSKISQIKDLFPEYGDGFISACLEVYDNDPEKVIERILEGTLHSDLLSLDTALMTKPKQVEQPVRDKGKGKVSEQTTSSKGKSVWEEKSSVSEQMTSSKGKSIWEDKSSAKESGSSSSLAGSTGASSGYSDGSTGEPTGNPRSNLGRYVRRQKDDGNFSELLDSRTENENEDVRAALRAAAAASEMEYEDEYDDSFDELGAYVADTGGNEETETLADEVVRRGRARDESFGTTNTGKPVVLTPWGSSSSVKGRGNSLGGQRATFQSQKSAAVVPEVDGQFHLTVPKGRGNLAFAQKAGFEPQKYSAVVPEIDGQFHQTISKVRGNLAGAQRASFAPQKSAPVVPVLDEGQDQDTATNPTAGQGRGGGRSGRGRKKWKEQGPKPEFYLKDGKLYNFKVAGAVGVASVEEAETIKQEEAETIHGLGAGGNVPVPQQDTNSSGRKTDGAEENSRKGGPSGEYGRQHVGDGGRGYGATGRGRGAPGRGSHGRRDDNHHRKDQATKKHFGGLGGF